MAAIQLTNVFKSVLLVNTLKIQQECVCQLVQEVHLLIIMWEYVWQYVQPPPIFMVTQQTRSVLKHVPQLQIITVIILQDYVFLTVHIHNQHLLIVWPEDVYWLVQFQVLLMLIIKLELANLFALTIQVINLMLITQH